MSITTNQGAQKLYDLLYAGNAEPEAEPNTEAAERWDAHGRQTIRPHRPREVKL